MGSVEFVGAPLRRKIEQCRPCQRLSKVEAEKVRPLVGFIRDFLGYLFGRKWSHPLINKGFYNPTSPTILKIKNKMEISRSEAGFFHVAYAVKNSRGLSTGFHLLPKDSTQHTRDMNELCPTRTLVSRIPILATQCRSRPSSVHSFSAPGHRGFALAPLK